MEIIKKLRKEKNETQQMLADVIGVSLRSIQNYESGKVTIPIEKLKAIAEHYNVSVSDLFKDIIKESSPALDEEIERLANDCLKNWDKLILHPYFQTKVENLVVKRINLVLEERLIKAEKDNK